MKQLTTDQDKRLSRILSRLGLIFGEENVLVKVLRDSDVTTTLDFLDEKEIIEYCTENAKTEDILDLIDNEEIAEYLKEKEYVVIDDFGYTDQANVCVVKVQTMRQKEDLRTFVNTHIHICYNEQEYNVLF